jgi:predicted HTH transcriptional regulator
MSAPIKKSTMTRVLEIIQDDPGVSRKHIQARLGDVTREQISHSLAGLRRVNKIENLGKHAKGASWYPKG